MDIPIIDFASCSLDVDEEHVRDEDVSSVGEAVYKAFAQIGFVYLKNTGIPSNQVGKVHSTMKDFFRLDLATKNKYRLDADIYGYVAYGVENTNPKRPGDMKEAFDITSINSCMAEKTWPDEDVPGFSKISESFAVLCRRLSMRIIKALTAGMKIKDKEYLMRCHSHLNEKGNGTIMRYLLYPPLPNEAEVKPGQIRLGEHSDYGSFTLLFQDQTGGLEVERCDGTFIHAVPIPGTVLVNIGDALQFWTRGRLKSTIHRILNPQDPAKRNAERTSLVYFVLPNDDVLLEEIDYDSSIENYNPILPNPDRVLTAKEHLYNMYQKTNMLSDNS